MTQPPYGQRPEPEYQQPQFQQPQYQQPQAEQGQYGQPQYQQPQQPQYQQAGPPGYGTPPPPTGQGGTNPLAVVSLVLGLLGGGLLSIILGMVALSQIRKRGQTGKGLAITGIVLGTLGILAFVAIIAVAVNAAPSTDASAPRERSGTVRATSLKVGECVNGLSAGLKEGGVGSLPAVPCSQPHEGEVFATFPVTGSTFPGDAEITAQAEKGCESRLAAYSASAAKDPALQITFLHPTESSWKLRDRTITCLVRDPDKKRTGSVKAGG